MSIVCLWWTRFGEGITLPRGKLSRVEKSNEVNIWRYGNGSANSIGRCDAIGFSNCFCFRGEMFGLANGRNEQRRTETGGGLSSWSSAPLISVRNLLI